MYRMSENRILRIILRSKTREKTGGWRKLDDEELYILYSKRGY
jgi:hypothetical protein